MEYAMEKPSWEEIEREIVIPAQEACERRMIREYLYNIRIDTNRAERRAKAKQERRNKKKGRK